ncbi:rho GTPase-activating protein 5-like [Hordeum vulgare]|nr:rho GTPase-activating protein 5-like [Hordeum vulgare]
MNIGWPTDVRHIEHVTFDRLQGFLGLPVEFELQIPCPAPSAGIYIPSSSSRLLLLLACLLSRAASVFSMLPESMQCGYDNTGSSVPKILLLMQERLYSQDGLKVLFHHEKGNHKLKGDLKEMYINTVIPEQPDHAGLPAAALHGDRGQRARLDRARGGVDANVDSFVLYRLFNKEDEETPTPVSEPPSTSSPANLLLQAAADDMASALIYESIGPG